MKKNINIYNKIKKINTARLNKYSFNKTWNNKVKNIYSRAYQTNKNRLRKLNIGKVDGISQHL